MELGIGKKLKELRESLGISQLNMGKRIGIKQNAVFKYENGISMPPIATLVAYADYFNVSLDWLCGRCESRKGKLYEGHNVDQEASLDGRVSELIKEGSLTYEKLKKLIAACLNKEKAK